jgi:hypothetical protein
MAEQKVELRKVRDFSENLNDTFLFIRQNFKPLVTSFLAIAGIFMLAHSILNGIYQNHVGGAFRDIINRRTTIPIDSPFGAVFNGTYFVLIFLAWANFVAMNVVVTCYMKLYDTLQGQAPTIEQVWNEFKKYFLKVLIFSIPISLLIVIGFLFCIVPGVYLAVVLTPFAVILIVDDATFGGAWDKCFAIIKHNFWPSLGVYLLVYLISVFSAGIISAVLGGITALISYFTTRDIVTTITIATSVLGVFSFIFYIVFYVSVCLHYFNLSERYDGAGMLRKIDSLGNGGTDFNNVQEQY